MIYKVGLEHFLLHIQFYFILEEKIEYGRRCHNIPFYLQTFMLIHKNVCLEERNLRSIIFICTVYMDHNFTWDVVSISRFQRINAINLAKEIVWHSCDECGTNTFVLRRLFNKGYILSTTNSEAHFNENGNIEEEEESYNFKPLILLIVKLAILWSS